MEDQRAVAALSQLLRATAEAHHEAYLASDGVDPEWPIWYAGYLQAHLGGLLGPGVTRSELVELLRRAERAHADAADGSDWPLFYARVLLER